MQHSGYDKPTNELHEFMYRQFPPKPTTFNFQSEMSRFMSVGHGINDDKSEYVLITDAFRIPMPGAAQQLFQIACCRELIRRVQFKWFPMPIHLTVDCGPGGEDDGLASGV